MLIHTEAAIAKLRLGGGRRALACHFLVTSAQAARKLSSFCFLLINAGLDCHDAHSGLHLPAGQAATTHVAKCMPELCARAVHRRHISAVQLG